jgi:prepilin-type N-terminal cleavage/methylation domain-containing protein
MRRLGRRGMTLIELLTTLLIVGILAQIALPAYQQFRRRADAARVIADINVIRVAALDVYADYGRYPATQDWTLIPLRMINALPQGFQFSYKTVEYRWHRFSLPNGLPLFPGQNVLIAVQVRTPDTRLMAAIRGTYKGRLAFGTSTSVYFVLE